jgi:ABC-type sugar transport system substrate-binding protein
LAGNYLIDAPPGDEEERGVRRDESIPTFYSGNAKPSDRNNSMYRISVPKLRELLFSWMPIAFISFAFAASSYSNAAAADKNFKVGMAVGGNTCCEWMKAQGDVARALAAQRGWGYLELSNENDPAVTAKNVSIFIQEKVDAVIQFNGQSSVNDVMAAKYAAAGIPVITYDIAHKGFYFVGVDNLAAGRLGGEAIGKVAKNKWDCKPDLIVSAEFTAVGLVNTWRTGGMREGLKKVCPDIPAEKYVSFEISLQAGGSMAAARDVRAAHPNAKKIIFVGISDDPVVAVIQAAEQLGRAQEAIGWGQDGEFITGPNVNPHLLGSVFYFLEGYATYSFAILDEIAAGSPPPMKDSAEDPAQRVPPCPVTATQAATVPDIQDRVRGLLAASKGTTEYDLFCPAK